MSKKRASIFAQSAIVNSPVVSTRYMLARNQSRNSHCQFHKHPATQHLCSVTVRLHHESRKVLMTIFSPGLAGVSTSCANGADGRYLPIMAWPNSWCVLKTRPSGSVKLSIIGTGQTAQLVWTLNSHTPTQIHRPSLRIELTTTAQDTPTLMEKTRTSAANSALWTARRSESWCHLSALPAPLPHLDHVPVAVFNRCQELGHATAVIELGVEERASCSRRMDAKHGWS